MKDRLSAPLTDIVDIDRRLDCVEVFCNNHHVAQHVQTQLKGCCDIERVVQKVSCRQNILLVLVLLKKIFHCYIPSLQSRILNHMW